MIILDTNVISEGFRTRPHPLVLHWLNEKSTFEFVLCTPVLAELRYGVERLPHGARRNVLDQFVTNAQSDLFGGEILDFDRVSAHEFGRVVAKRNRLGRPISQMDALIAAIAIANSASIATRDVDGFTGLGIDVMNPFEAITR